MTIPVTGVTCQEGGIDKPTASARASLLLFMAEATSMVMTGKQISHNLPQ